MDEARFINYQISRPEVSGQYFMATVETILTVA